jgi:phenylacetate-CoA ligase
MNLASLRKNIFEPLYLKKSDSPKLAYWRTLEKTQYYSRQQLEEIQWQRLQDIWKFIWQNNDFYKKRFVEAGLTEQSLKSPADIIKLPLLTKKEIRVNTEGMISDGFDKERLLYFKTGGSTGKALDIYMTEECSELRNACARRHDRWTGWNPGEPVGAAWGNPKLPDSIKEKLINALVQPYIYLDTMAVSEQSVHKFALSWKRVKPTLLFGHAHSLFILAQHVKEMGVDEIQPTGILSTSMMLLPHERAFMEKVFRCKVTDRYGCEEVSLIGSECEKHNGMHMNIEHLVIEFVKDDGTYACFGEPGNIVVTDLMNKAMPFIRYKVEDVGVPLDKACSCGRGLPLMGKITGRVADFLIKSDATKIAGISLIENTLTKMPGIDQMQVIQKTLDDIVLNIVPGMTFSEPVQSALSDYFNKIFPGTNVTVNRVKEILPEPSGKYRFSICRILDAN